MPYELENRLVIGLDSSALFNLEESDKVFREQGELVYRDYQRQHQNRPLAAGVAFPFIKRLVTINAMSPSDPPTEVVLLSRNDPVSGMRVFRSCNAHGLPSIQRGVFTQGRDPFRYLRSLGAHLFLSANEADVREALHLGYPAARVVTESVRAGDANPHEVRIAFDGDAVLFSDEAEQVFQRDGLAAFQQHERDKATQPLPEGPFKPLLAALHRLQQAGSAVRIRMPAAPRRTNARSRP